jgi:hypothetical protein
MLYADWDSQRPFDLPGGLAAAAVALQPMTAWLILGLASPPLRSRERMSVDVSAGR